MFHKTPKKGTPGAAPTTPGSSLNAFRASQLDESRRASPKAGDLESPILNDRARGQLMNDNRLVSRLPADSPRRKPTLPKIGGEQ